MADGAFEDYTLTPEPAGKENGAPIEPADDAQFPYPPKDEESTSVSDREPDLSRALRDLTDRILQFLSTASNETLGACLAALAATTYLFLGRIGLVLIGVVGGVTLHAAWEGHDSHAPRDGGMVPEAKRRKEKGLDIVQRILGSREGQKATHDSNEDGDSDHEKDEELDFSGFQPDTKTALEGFVDAVIRDYVHWWYKPILPNDTSFPSACRQTLSHFILSLSTRLSRKRPADMFLDFLTNSSSIIIVFLSELSAAISAGRGVEARQAIGEYLEDNPMGSLANVLDEEQQKRKLKAVSEDVLQTFLDAKAYACEPVKAFLREVLAGLILAMTVTSCSRADFINEWIIYALEDSGTTELVEAIDVGVSNAAGNNDANGEATSSNGVAIEGGLGGEGSQAKAQHRRTVSKAEAAMEEAMQEAQKLNQMIAEEEARKKHQDQGTAATGEKPVSDPKPDGLDSDIINDAVESPNAANLLNGSAVEDSSTAAARPSPGFKSFNDILASQTPTALRSDSDPSILQAPPSLTLHNAKISIFDDSIAGEKEKIRSKPIVEYLLQIEPASSHHPGWMIPRKYSDIETLHEVLRRISVISGVEEFAKMHATLPTWKGNTKSTLRTDLERYLQDALSFRRLAESEGMKRFLEKDQHTERSSPNPRQATFPAAFETVGKGMLGVITSAPKGAATGGKAIVGGVTGVFGGVASLGQKKTSPKPPTNTSMRPPPTSSPTPSQIDPPGLHKQQQATSPATDQRPQSPQKENVQLASDFTTTRGSVESPSNDIRAVKPDTNALHSGSIQEDGTSPYFSNSNHVDQESIPSQPGFNLPPPPSEISDDYNTLPSSSSSKLSFDSTATARTSTSTVPPPSSPPPNPAAPSIQQPSTRAPATPLTPQETTVAIELFFATVNELYTLSSAWSLRLTLLNTAKSFLLRGGSSNSNFEAIRQLLQSTIIDTNTTDAGIAAHINKTRATALPTEDELKAWPPPLTEEESERKRVRARELLVKKGMPQALVGVMGQAATQEALGKVFDCLQVPEVAKGLVFAVLLQGVRAIVQ